MAWVDEFGPVYAVYTLWFNDNGITTAQISTAFMVWAIVALALEIPSGALADRVDRRRLVGAAFAIRASGLSLWLLWPTFTGLIVGTALWATHDALASGAWEALIHDELDAIDEAPRYETVMARVGQFSHLGVASGTLLGAALLQGNTALDTLGWITVAAHAASITMVLTLPDVRWVRAATGTSSEPAIGIERSIGAGPVAETILTDVERAQAGGDDWWTTLRTGVDEARRNSVVRRLLIVGALLEGLFILDEYLPLIARARGGDDSAAPIIVLVVWLGLLTGGEYAARRPATTGKRLGGALVVACVVGALAFVGGSVWLLMLVAVPYGVLEATYIAADARLQERAPRATRATVASVRGFGSAAVSMLAFAIIGWTSNGDDPTRGHFVILAALALTAILVVRWLPAPNDSGTST